MTQERQGRGWFGHGTASAKAPPSGGLFAAVNYGPRIDAIAHTAVAHLPRADWHRASVAFDEHRLALLSRVYDVWIEARSRS